MAETDPPTPVKVQELSTLFTEQAKIFNTSIRRHADALDAMARDVNAVSALENRHGTAELVEIKEAMLRQFQGELRSINENVALFESVVDQALNAQRNILQPNGIWLLRLALARLLRLKSALTQSVADAEAGQEAISEFRDRAEKGLLPGSIRVTSTPEGATIFINEISRGQVTPSVLELLGGTYRVQVKLEGNPVSEVVNITVRPGESINVPTFELRKDERETEFLKLVRAEFPDWFNEFSDVLDKELGPVVKQFTDAVDDVLPDELEGFFDWAAENFGIALPDGRKVLFLGSFRGPTPDKSVQALYKLGSQKSFANVAVKDPRGLARAFSQIPLEEQKAGILKIMSRRTGGDAAAWAMQQEAFKIVQPTGIAAIKQTIAQKGVVAGLADLGKNNALKLIGLFAGAAGSSFAINWWGKEGIWEATLFPFSDAIRRKDFDFVRENLPFLEQKREEFRLFSDLAKLIFVPNSILIDREQTSADFSLQSIKDVLKASEEASAEIAVNSTPDKAAIFIEGPVQFSPAEGFDVQFVPKTGIFGNQQQFPTNTTFKDVAPGTYIIYVTKTGFEPAAIAKEVEPNKQTEFKFSLRKLDPEETPLVIPLEPRDPPASPRIGKGAITFTVNTRLKPIVDGLVASFPDVVFTYQLTPGQHRIELRKDGFRSVTETVTIIDGQIIRKDFVLQEEAVAQPTVPTDETLVDAWRVDVSSTPSSAKISIDDAFTGKFTPDFVVLLPGTYKFTITKSGFQPFIVIKNLPV